MLQRTNTALVAFLVSISVGIAFCVATAAFAQSAADPENLSTNARFLVAARNADACGPLRSIRDVASGMSLTSDKLS